MSQLRRVCVFCGSNSGRRPEYVRAARELGRELARRGVGLVYGGANVGLMAEAADAVLASGGEAIGVIPRFMMRKEIAHQGLSELHIVETMHQRKACMAELSDGFVALPGGLGTLEEFCEVVTWAQLGLHPKPCGLLDAAGFYADLIRFLDHCVVEGFVRVEHRAAVISASSPGELLDRFAEHQPVEVSKWIDGKALT